MDRFFPTEWTCFCVVESQGKLLMQAKTDSEFEPSLTFPGGHVEPDESVTQAATRELFEECGLHADAWQQQGFVNFKRDDGKRELIFICTTSLPEPLPTKVALGKNEGQTQWLPIGKIKGDQLNSVVNAVFEAYVNHKHLELFFE
jgi:ADP-ribose pyrophosphatase YjhB (NUDIX family)